MRSRATDGYLPRSFTNRDRRLVYSEGIIVLTIFSSILLWAFGYFLHNQRGDLLAGLLFLKGDRRIVTINVPWYLSE